MIERQERQSKTTEEMKGVRDSDDSGHRERTERAKGRRQSRGKERGKGVRQQTDRRNPGLLRPAVSLHSPSRVPPPHHPIKAVAGRAFADCFLE